MTETTPRQTLAKLDLPKVRASELRGRGWLNTGGKDVTLEQLRGKIVILDFWTFCCINCLHVLDELRELEEKYADELVIIGVHSPKFVHEADPEALAAAVDRYEVHHPVLDDPELLMWREYTARAWPTLVVIDPEGYIVAHLAGEGHAHSIDALLGALVQEHEAKGTLHRGDGPFVLPEPEPTTLRFPAKAVALSNGNFLVADAGHHSLAEIAPDWETLVRRIGTGDRGFADGGPEAAQFSEPNGLCVVPPEYALLAGYDVVVADTVNHALRGVRLLDGHVQTLAGNGLQYLVGGPDNDGRLSSPWDVAFWPELGKFVVAMAGNHTLWTFDPATATAEWFAGTMNEGLTDGTGSDAWFAQPSGLAVGPVAATGAGSGGGSRTDAVAARGAGDGAAGASAGTRVWVADSETSALRFLDLDGGPKVSTAIGQGLFDFGLRDGEGSQALMQHPLGVAALPDGSVAIADTYNGAVRRYDPASGQVTTLATGLREPSGLVVSASGGSLSIAVVESAAHRLTRLTITDDLAGEVRGGPAHKTQRPVTDVAPGTLDLSVVFTPAPGQKYDDRYGPSTRLTVSASPENLILEGSGSAVELIRTVRINPEVTEGVLHVTAQAASCDNDPAIEFPACHLAQQDWGVPVRVVAGGAGELELPLLG